MKKTAVVVAPGRGTYNKAELGYLARHHADKSALIAGFDRYRQDRDQQTISALDGAARYASAKHTSGDNASPLIYACAIADFLSIDRDRIDVVAITGNSMGWYIALACAGAMGAMGGLNVVNTMGNLMQENLIGGQLIHPFVDENWVDIPGRQRELLDLINGIGSLAGHDLALSIDLGGMMVVAGNDAGLGAFETRVERVQDRFPMRLANHAAFHTALQTRVAAKGRAALGVELFSSPQLALVDGRGAIWHPKSCEPTGLWRYTLDDQVVQPYDFTSAIRVAAREFMPDMFIVLGPGTTLGGAVAQSLIRAKWRGWTDKPGFQDAQSKAATLISMGRTDQRGIVSRQV